MPKINNAKKVLVGFKGTESEKKFLIQMAEKSNMNLSEYCRARLFAESEVQEENTAQPLNQYNQDLIRLVTNSYGLLNMIASKDLDREEVKDIGKKAKEWLKKKGY